MGMNIDDEQLLGYLLKFVSGVPVQCDEIRLVDLYGNKKPSQLFDNTTTHHHHHVFTQLKKKKRNGKNFNRGIVGGGGSWIETMGSRPVYDKTRSLIGFKRTFRFDEENHVWNMKEYQLSDDILKNLRLHGQIRHEEEFAVCRITRSVNSSNHNVENFLASCSSQCQGTVKSFVQENQDLGQSRVIPCDELNSILNVTQLPAAKEEECSVSLLPKESNVAAATEEECSVRPDYDIATYHKKLDAYAASKLDSMVYYIPEPQEEECSVPVVHQETPSVRSNLPAAKEEEECSVRLDYDIATYHKELDAYAATQLESMVPYIPEQQKDEDEIPLFGEDFNVGHADLWS